MKKYLIFLSSISAIGVGAIAGTINTNNNHRESINSTTTNAYLLTKDEVKYDITKNLQSVSLENLLSSLKELNKIHTEQGKEVVLSGLPPLVLLDDEGITIGQSYMSSIAWVSLNSLLNSNTANFDNISMTITNNEITVVLYDNDQIIELFSYKGDKPTVQDHMAVVVSLQYEVN